MLSDSQTASPLDRAAEKVQPRGGLARRLGVGLLIGLTWLGLIQTVVFGWAYSSILTTDGFVRSIEPVVRNPEFQQALGAEIAGQLVLIVGIEQHAQSALPPLARPLVGLFTSTLQGTIERMVVGALGEPRVQQAILEALRISHGRMLAVLRGDTRVIQADGDQLRFNLFPVLDALLPTFDGQFPGLLEISGLADVRRAGTADEARAALSRAIRQPLSPTFGEIVLLESSAVAIARQAVRAADVLVWFIPLLTVVLGAASVALARRRRQALTWLVVGGLIAVIVAVTLIRIAHPAIIALLPAGAARGVGDAVIGALIGNLVTLTALLTVAGVVGALVIAFVGLPSVLSRMREHPFLVGAGLLVTAVALLFVELNWLSVLGILFAGIVIQVLIRLFAPARPADA
ncbi:MAG: hypothetical protein U0556_15840 [Dehalococcoidia bacterium]